ncbi:MAG: ABC transporter permease [Oscillospiraceae bacterium]|nr:ABC transporter permease [Oscillospiraceae bacterium]
MKLFDMIKMTLQNLTRRKSRTILTVLGVVVGCCAIVTMMSIGFGVQNSQQIMLEGMGDLTLIQVYSNGRKDSKLDDTAIRKFQNIANVDVAVGKTQLNNVGMTIFAGNNDRYQMQWVQIVGINKDAMEKFGFQLLEGDYPKQPFEVLAGQYTAYNLMDTMRPEGQNVISRWDYMYTYDPNTGMMTENDPSALPDPYMKLNGQTLKLELYSYENFDVKKYQEIKVTGVVKEDYNKDYATSEGLIFFTTDLQALQKMFYPSSSQKMEYSEIFVKAKDISQVADIESDIKKMGYSTYSMESVRKPLEEEARKQQMMLGGLGAVSLFVAALGICNTMIMSISERTREIGVMKALGCYLGNIRTVFLLEAGFIGLIGGIIGSVLSFLISVGMNFFTNAAAQSIEVTDFATFWTKLTTAMDVANSPMSIVPLWLYGFAIVFSIIIGLGSGFYPANKAVHISAMEAIKRE